jgi:hypothetical protein
MQNILETLIYKLNQRKTNNGFCHLIPVICEYAYNIYSSGSPD